MKRRNSERRRGKETWPLVVALGLGMALAGCTGTLAYRYADWLILWRIDRYFDLTSEQGSFLSSRLSVLHAQHRHEALPHYVAFLTQVQQDFREGLTAEKLERTVQSYERLRTDLFERFVEDGSQFFPTVSPRQVGYLTDAFREENEELLEKLQQDTNVRLAHRADATLEWVEGWVGSLTPTQEQTLRHMSLELPDSFETWVRYRQQRQRTFLGLIQAARRGEMVRPKLQEWVRYPYRESSEEFLRSQQRLREEVKDMAIAVDRMLTPGQQDHLIGELQELVDDLQDLQEG